MRSHRPGPELGRHSAARAHGGRRRLPSLLAAAALAAGGVTAVVTTPGAAASTSTVVDELLAFPADASTILPAEWYKRYETGVVLSGSQLPAGNTVELVTGPATPPAGGGSMALTTANTTVQGKATLFNYGMVGTRLADLDQISFWSYTGTSPIAAVLQMEIFRDGVNNAGFTTLSLEPSNGNGGPTLNQWEQYRAGPGLPGKVWLSGTVPTGGQNAPITWDDLLAAYPTAEIFAGVGLNLGRGPTTGTVHADKVEITTATGTTTFDFEPSTYVTQAPEGANQTVAFAGLTELGSPSITGTFGAGATVTVSPYAGPETTPFTVTGTTVDIDVTGFTPPVTICLDSTNPTDRLWHFVNDVWEDVTVDGSPSNGRVCGDVTWFSPFAVGAPIPGPDVVDVAGFTSPVDMGGVVNIAKAGQGIPLKFRITDGGVGVEVPGLAVAVTAPSNCSALSGSVTDVLETYTGASGLQYLGDGNYQWNWKTPKTYANTCRTLTLTPMADGYEFSTASLQALFQFRK